MDYETSDGSQFSLREIWSGDDERDTPDFQCTLITAFVDGNAYAGKSLQRMEEMDDVDVIGYLEPVPSENIFPIMPKDFTIAPAFDMSNHYLKAPQFTYEDSRPGQTFVADRMRNEASVLEHLMKHPHPSIVTYFGCVLKDGRITHLCLKRCYCNLAEYAEVGLSDDEKDRLLKQVQEGWKHLHSLGLAHNDINPGNICVDSAGNAMIVDFDSCVPFGQSLVKGVASVATEKGAPVSGKRNDYQAFKEVVQFLKKDRERSSACYPQIQEGGRSLMNVKASARPAEVSLQLQHASTMTLSDLK